MFCAENGAPSVAVSNSLCTGTAPATSSSCNSQACSVRYTSSAWSSCTVTCGGGTQTRTNTCERFLNGAWSATTVDKCSSLTAPTTSQTCNTAACATYRWVLGNFGTCSVSCGGGTQTRTVVCYDSSNAAVADSLCAAPKPITSQSCNSQACTQVYTWEPSAWSTCSVECGGGLQTRTLRCADSSGTTLPDTSCYNVARPTTVQSCNSQLCPNYQWYTSPYGTCPCFFSSFFRLILWHRLSVMWLWLADANCHLLQCSELHYA